jgi:hypothetical protein
MQNAPEQFKRYALDEQIRSLPDLLQVILLGAAGDIGALVMMRMM